MSTPRYYLSAAGGVCRHWDSPSICFALNAIQLAGTAHYAVMIAFCSCYRYYVIAGSHHGEPKRMNILFILFAIHLPTLIVYANFAFSPLLEGPEMEQVMNESHPEYDISMHSDQEMLLVTRYGLSVRLALYWLEGLIIPVVIVVIIGAIRINRILASIDHMSANSKRRHTQILKGILWQATLPGLYAIGLIVYVATKRKLINTDGIEYITIMIGSLITVLGPIFTLYFTLPYRNELKRLLPGRIYERNLSDVSSPIMSKEAPVTL